jgi:hypothetical protein
MHAPVVSAGVFCDRTQLSLELPGESRHYLTLSGAAGMRAVLEYARDRAEYGDLEG